MKQKSFFECQECEHQEPRWLGRCPNCGAWNSFVEGRQEPKGISTIKKTDTQPVPLSSVEIKEKLFYNTGIAEINRVLGGGVIKGSSILVGGEPGIGKSTLLLQIAQSIETKGRILYVSGEESLGQIKLRAQRLNINDPRIEIFCCSQLELIMKTIETLKPVVVILDSVQTLCSDEVSSVPGSPSQMKLCCTRLNELAKSRDLGLFLIGHVTKEGLIAGPKVIEHLVDTVLYFEAAGTEIRVLRSTKNRFASTDELGLFTMTEKGLDQVSDPASIFLQEREGPMPSGVAVASVYEGTRVLLIEIQSLVVPAKGGISRVFSDKIDSRRISRLAAVLEKHVGLPFADTDIYVNIAGGVKITEVGIDLPILLALYSAKTGCVLPENTAVLGEVTLAGEVRRIPQLPKRIKAAVDMGYEKVIGPVMGDLDASSARFYVAVSSVRDVLQLLFK
ncbi:MAG: DNA repair protein RadA [Spirochaetales bacterium]|nr:DNA repair protein RadA [Spirochaetales bacterium]